MGVEPLSPHGARPGWDSRWRSRWRGDGAPRGCDGVCAVVLRLASRRAPRNSVVDGVRPRAARLADLAQHLLEPLALRVEVFSAGDARELDAAQHVARVLVEGHYAGDALARALHRQLGAARDQVDVRLVRLCGAGVVAALLDEDLFGADEGREGVGKVLSRVDGVELDVAEGVALHLLAVRLHLCDDVLDARTLRDEDVDVVVLVEDLLEPRGLSVDVDLQLGDVHRVHV
mmetsp:Transcript_49671/g.157206  ORF Transcript_49671/g.157206 Transcript_49671/m.157206 type:complete len:231 (-) Transcript_49671:38-730(-)